MSNFAQDIKRAANGEPIEGIVIGVRGWYDDNEPDTRVLSWDEAEPLLDYEYSTDYGAPECHAINAWTANRVLLVGQYDGSTWVTWVPRNPTAIRPTMVGGG